MIKQKIKASLIHFTLSMVLITLVVSGIIYLWFPGYLLGVTDFKEVAFLIISVDLVLGPLLTFVVYQPKKKTLKFDLSVIAAIQLSALTYGSYALFQIHPVFVTFNVDRFTLVSAKDAEPEKATHDDYKISKLKTTAKLAFAKMPEDREKKNELTLSAAGGGEDLDKREEYYEPYDENISSILAKSLNPKMLFSEKNEEKEIDDFLNEYKDNLEDFAFYPIKGSSSEAIIVLNKQTAKPVTVINTDPWDLLIKNAKKPAAATSKKKS